MSGGACGEGRGAGRGSGVDVAIGPMAPSAFHAALVCEVGVASSMTSSVAVIADASGEPGTSDDPCQTSPRSNSKPLSRGLPPTRLSGFPMVAACAVVVWKNCCSGCRTSMVDDREIAMTRRRTADDATTNIRLGSAISATSERVLDVRRERTFSKD